MKKFLTLALSALLTMGLLTACGGKTTDKTVDLTAFYNTLAEEYGWAEDAASSGEEDIMMMNLEGDMLEGSYPGLADVATKQLIAKAPMISAVVNEIVLAECGTEEDAATAASILQDPGGRPGRGRRLVPGVHGDLVQRTGSPEWNLCGHDCHGRPSGGDRGAVQCALCVRRQPAAAVPRLAV